MQSRIHSPARSGPGARDARLTRSTVATRGSEHAGLWQTTSDPVNLRAGEINGRRVCREIHRRIAKKAGETGERLYTLAGSRDAPHVREYEPAIAASTVHLAALNFAKRLNVTAGPVPGEWTAPVATL